MSQYGITLTVLSTTLSEAIEADKGKGNTLSAIAAGVFGENLSEWLRNTAREISGPAREGISIPFQCDCKGDLGTGRMCGDIVIGTSRCGKPGPVGCEHQRMAPGSGIGIC